MIREIDTLTARLRRAKKDVARRRMLGLPWMRAQVRAQALETELCRLSARRDVDETLLADAAEQMR